MKQYQVYHSLLQRLSLLSLNQMNKQMLVVTENS